MTFLVTTPIFYVNAKPHLGHAYSMVLADAIARWTRSDLSTGTDEHGIKVWKAAQAASMDTGQWCKETSNRFKQLADGLNIHYCRFIRTTDEDHIDKVQWLWNRLVDRGAIHKGQHSGWYSVTEERFLTDREATVADRKNLQFISEENYKFKLHSFTDKVSQWLSEKKPIIPESRVNDVLPFLQKTIEEETELSVSRQRDAMQWGIPVPGDDRQVIYVWLDALVNYLTVNKECNRKFIHIMGMDILKFHALYWPAFLIAAGLEDLLPEQLVVHGHWLMEGQKMSKSIGNVVDPMQLIADGSPDMLRWFLLRNTNLRSDQDFDHDLMIKQYNQDLVNIGNLWSRVNGSKLRFDKNNHEYYGSLVDDVSGIINRTKQQYDKYDFQSGILGILEALGLCNRFVSDSKPWTMSDASLVRNTIRSCLTKITPLLSPIVPKTANHLAASLLSYQGPLIPRHQNDKVLL